MLLFDIHDLNPDLDCKSSIMTRFLGIFFLGVLLPQYFLGQNVGDKFKISGKVTDQRGEALPGVNILVKGTPIGTPTDIDGNYSLLTYEGAVLVYSFVGYTDREIAVGSQTVIDVVLSPFIKSLDEIMVVGYGTQQAKDVTGSTYKLDRKDFNPGIVNSPEDLFQGKIPGVDVMKNSGEPGTGIQVRIRGASTIRANNTPLYVIDGYPLDIATTVPELGFGFEEGRGNPANPLLFLNPDDIESIDILKDASAAAIYGARGSNGVVLITTKKGQPGETGLTYSTYFSLSKLPAKIEVLSPDAFRAGQRSVAESDSLLAPILVDTLGNLSNDLGFSTIWQEEIFRSAFTQNHDISFSGGSFRTNYRASINYLDQEWTMETSGLKRYAARINLRHLAVNDRLSLELNLVPSRTDHRQIFGASSGVISDALRGNPTLSVRDDNGNFTGLSFLEPNAVASLELTENGVTTNKILGNLMVGIEILEGLEYKINVGTETSVATRRLQRDRRDPALGDFNRYAEISEKELTSALFENYLTYNHRFQDQHDVKVMGGYSYQHFQNKTFYVGASDFESDEIPFVNNIQVGINDLGQFSGNEKNALQSFFGRANYGFRDKYLFTFNFRRDGSTRFGDNNQYGDFPSAAIAWRVSEEDFLQGFAFLNNLKLRASWGITGNQEIPNKISQAVLGAPFSAMALLDASTVPVQGFTFVATPNPDLKWEETRQFDVGLDFPYGKTACGEPLIISTKKPPTFWY